MAYDVANPPALISQRVGSIAGAGVWAYASLDDATAGVAADYITNGLDLGMELGDVVNFHETDTVITTHMFVKAISAAGAVTLVAM